MTIAVTAASGQLGSAIIRALSQITDEPIIGLARSPEKAAGLGVEIRPGDYADREQMEKSLAGIGTLLLVSGMAAPDERIGQHRNVIEAARANGVRKIVYTSIQGAETGTAFSPIVQSNRQTEADIRASGLDWAIGRNGIYIEPDVDYLDNYKASGEIANCAGDGKCGYTTRDELAFAYASMLTEPTHHGRTYRLHGEPISQTELAAYFNRAFGTDLRYRAMSVSDYQAERIAALGEFMGTIIAGIYEGIRLGALETESEFAKAAGRPHQGWDDYFASFRR
ncbi:SDR family oxidoreductase [Sphingorhabdus sp. YGSMI21]|uniref:SDR family oxidoreductase n=1 Tax=Sphingorhabdus sp. YGSMI21 TaxID=2077182 RepID=UPI000C1E13B8|nr:SDR family oxidoreductase [Sphingorhabdus sp. YGSMI21]ATW05091.1 NAD(P)-dependent oxidoreductase [Sphingorhabdus sp. YGSMI21]